MSYCKALMDNQSSDPESYWANISSNDILFDILNKADSGDQLEELEKLVFGGTVNFILRSNITVKDFDDLSALWSVLAHSGYLTPLRARRQ
jgi:hypothetical protein